MKSKGVGTTMFVVVAACSAAATADFIDIGEGRSQSWTQAMMSGRLFAVDPSEHGTPQVAQTFYATQGNAVFVPSHLTPDLMASDGTGETHQSLVMQWNPPMQGETLAVASWQYNTLNLRPGGLDLRGQSVHFSLLAPPGVWDISFMLQDKFGRWSGWFMPMPPPNWSQQWIMFNQGNQGGWQNFTDPLFDLSNVVALRLDEAGRIVTFPLPPPGAPAGFWDWNAFDSIIVTPAPGTLTMFGAAMLLGGTRRRRAA